ncbi:hypothetical protein PR048_033049 [Dryococelus australis]|uniref:Uncharacterized protein n=1 Tax=Dryococelus australis TaxID=614101 RepID=A0ABQ9G3E5_9NEOP|nr:hypothetical protein PR048_033049 [Dryococelus australis]
MAFVRDPFQHSPGFGKPWKTEIRIAGPGTEPGSLARLVVRLLASQQGELGSIPGGVAPGYSHVGIVTDDAASRGSPVSPTLAFRGCFILTSIHPTKRVKHREKKNLDSDYGPDASLITPNMSQTTYENSKEQFLDVMKLHITEYIDDRTREESSSHERNEKMQIIIL